MYASKKPTFSGKTKSNAMKGFFATVQPRLAISNSNDVYEQEADVMTEKAIRKEQSEAQAQPLCLQLSEVNTYNTISHKSIQRVPATTGNTFFPQINPMSSTPQMRNRPTGNITRAVFDDYLTRYYGVTNIHTGSQTEQEQRITRHNVPSPTISGWQTWDPGATSEDYTNIINGVEEMINTLGAIPNINTVIFFQIEYEPDPTTGIGIPHPNTGASFGAGELVIYEAFSGSTNQAAGISTSAGTPLQSTGRGENIANTIIHELGHGVGEAGSNNSPVMFQQYNATIGWIGNPTVLYDIGQPAVRASIAAGTPIAAQYIITPQRWNDPTVNEQPMSRYAVEGGPGEDFAESIRAYVTTPSVLQQRSPWRYNFIHSNMQNWLTRMNRIQPGIIPPPVGDFPTPTGDTRWA